MSVNKAKFSINASPASDLGFIATSAQVLTIQLESSTDVSSVRFELYDVTDPESPLASLSAPDLTFAGGVHSKTLNPASGTTTITMVTELTHTHAWVVRATAATDQGDHVFERIIALTNGKPRKTVPAESTQFSARGWADAWAELIDYVLGAVAAGGTGLIVSGTPALDNVPTWNGTQAVWASKTSFNITGFVATAPTVEVGATVSNPAFTASYSGAVVTAVLTNNKTAESKDVHATPTSFSSSASHAFTTVGEAWTFTDTAAGSITGDTATASITARQRNVAGVVTIGNTSPATLFAAAISSALSSSGAFSFTFTDDGTHEVQFFRRTAYGAPTSVKDNTTGFGVSFSLVGTSSWTNPSGFSENVNLYKLDNPVNGTKTIVVT